MGRKKYSRELKARIALDAIKGQKKMSITEPGQVWCSDITYIRLAHGFVYLTAVKWIGQAVMC